MVLPISRG